MAGDWIKMRSCLHTHPKVVRIASALNADRLRVIGALQVVWCLFDMHSTDGRLDGYSPEAVDVYIAWPGFSAQMMAVNWLHSDITGLTVPSFDSHNGQSAKRRAQEAERKRRGRAEEAEEGGEDESVSDADKKRTREELSREELKSTTSMSSGDDPLPCPFDAIVGLYHKHMPINPRVKVLNAKRKGVIRQRWREAAALTCKPFGYSTVDSGLLAWDQFFRTCAQSDFLIGKARPAPGKPPFIASIDFLFSPDGFVKTLENKYHREAA